MRMRLKRIHDRVALCYELRRKNHEYGSTCFNTKFFNLGARAKLGHFLKDVRAHFINTCRIVFSTLSDLYKTVQRNLYSQLQASQQDYDHLKTEWGPIITRRKYLGGASENTNFSATRIRNANS